MSRQDFRLPEEVPGQAMPDEPVVEIAPGKEPQTPAEWIKVNLFSGLLNTIITIVAGAFSLFVLYQAGKFVFVTGDWTVFKSNARQYMTGRFPLEQLWRVWAIVYAVLFLAGASRGLSPYPVIWSRRRAVAGGLLGVFVLFVVNYVVDTFFLWALIFIGGGTLVGAFFLARALGDRIRRSVLLGWALVFPFTLVILRMFGGVPPRLWGGFLVNIIVAVVGIAVSFPIGLLLALGRRSTFPAIRAFCVGCIEIIRGAPLYTLLIFGVFVLPLMLPPGMGKPPNMILAGIMLTIFSSAYVAEIVRGGLQGVHDGQYEAARALGLSVTRMTALVILPQALRSTIPAMISHFISLFKDTSLLATVAITEMLRNARRSTTILEFTDNSQEALLAAAAIFWIVAFSMSRWSQRLEGRLGVGER